MNEYKFSVIIKDHCKLCVIKARTFASAYKQITNRGNVQQWIDVTLPSGRIVEYKNFDKLIDEEAKKLKEG